MAARCGLKPVEFWRLTPREFRRYLRGYDARRREDLAYTLIGSFHAAAWQRAKRLPDLGRIVRKIVRAERREQTPAESLRIAERLNAMFGGKDLRAQRRKKKGT